MGERVCEFCLNRQVKTCKQSEGEQSRKDFLQEAKLLQAFSHPNVMGLIGIVTQSESLMIVVEYVTYGDLRAVLKACRVKGIHVTHAEMTFMANQVCFASISNALSNFLLCFVCIISASVLCAS